MRTSDLSIARRKRSITRRKARELALQALYAVASTGAPIEQALADLAETGKIPDQALQFPAELCKKCLENQARFDGLIEQAAEHWALERIARIDRILLRMALTELFFFLDIPPKATINEAIELARKFSTENSAQFVNGLLDRIARQQGVITTES